MLRIILVVLKRKKYFIIALFTTFIMGAISYYLTVINVYHKSIIIYAEMNGFWFTIVSFLLSLVIAVFFGAYIALLFFRKDIVKAKAAANKATSGVGVITGIVASGCPSCGTPLLGLVGFPLGLFSLPFRGLELKVLSIAFLLLSIYLISKNVRKNLTRSCPVESSPDKLINVK